MGVGSLRVGYTARAMSPAAALPGSSSFGPLHPDVVEVASGVLQDFDGVTHEVQGGAYLPPGTVLSASAELERLRDRRVAEASSALPLIVLGSALAGLALGYWLGNRGPSRRR